MNQKAFLFSLLPALLFTMAPTSPALASSCLNGSCHQDLTKPKHLHGPIGAEMAGVKACIICHTPSATPCSPKQGGKFLLQKDGVCLTCHNKVSGSQHSNEEKACLNCHDPHGSNTSPFMLREKP